LGSLTRALPLPFFAPIGGLDVVALFLVRFDGSGRLGSPLERSSLAIMDSEHQAMLDCSESCDVHNMIILIG